MMEEMQEMMSGLGGGQADDVPALLSEGEFVIPADVVSALGDGSSEAGIRMLEQMIEKIRSRSRQAPPQELPPKAQSPLQAMSEVV